MGLHVFPIPIPPPTSLSTRLFYFYDLILFQTFLLENTDLKRVFRSELQSHLYLIFTQLRSQ